MTPRSKRPLWFLAGGVIVIVGLLVLRPRLQHSVMLRTALAERSVSAELIEELIATDPAPLAVIERFFRTGKIPHRLAALRAFSRSSLLTQVEGTPDWLRDAALDVDFQVREQALGILSTLRPAGAAPLIRASLLDVDPELKHVAIRAAVAVGATNLIAEVAGLLDHDSLNVRIAAATALRQWSGEDFGVRRAQLGAEYNDLSSAQKEVDPAALTKVEAGLAEWQAWWRENQSAWTMQAAPEAVQPVETLRAAPEFALPDLAGNMVRLSELRGRPVLVNFWATWCTACWSELPELIKLHERYGEKLVILGISLDGLPDQHELEHGHKESDHAAGETNDHEHTEPAPAATPRDALVKLVEGFAKQKGLNYRILLDPEGVSSLVYQGNELPVNVFIDAQGNLRRRFVGPRSPEAFDAMIAEVAAPSR